MSATAATIRPWSNKMAREGHPQSLLEPQVGHWRPQRASQEIRL